MVGFIMLILCVVVIMLIDKFAKPEGPRYYFYTRNGRKYRGKRW